MRVLIDNEEMKISVSENFCRTLKDYSDKSLGDFILENTVQKFDLYRKIFQVDKLEKIYFEIYDIDKEKDQWCKKYITIYGKNPPEYSTGYFEPSFNLSSCCMHTNAIYGTGWWYNAVCTNAHEAFHLFYRKYVYGDDRIVWFDEGMAQYLSGEKDDWLNDDKKLSEKFNYFLKHYIPIDNLNERVQGNTMVSDDKIFQRENVFNGYLASVLIIKYIVLLYGEDYLFTIMKDNSKIRELGSHILNDMVEYFQEKFNISNGKEL